MTEILLTETLSLNSIKCYNLKCLSPEVVVFGNACNIHFVFLCTNT